MKSKQKKILNSLFSISLLILGVLLKDNVQAEEEAPSQAISDDAKLIQDKDGNSVQIKKDGSKLIKKTDGSSIEIKADGTKFIYVKDGTLIQVNTDGVKKIKKPDGTIIEINPKDEVDNSKVKLKD